MVKKILTLFIVGLFFAQPIFAQTQFNVFRSLVPETDSKYYLGTTTPSLRAWLRVIADSFYDTDASDGCAEWSSNVLTSTGSACGSGSGGSDFTSQSWGNSTTSVIGFFGGLFSNASTTFSSNLFLSSLGQGLLFAGTSGKVDSVATTTLTATSPLSLSQPVVKVGGSNSILTVSTTTNSIFSGLGGNILEYRDGLGWFGIATSSINVGTASALFDNGSNCSAGSFPLGIDASGAVETCTDAWTEAENTSAGYTSNTGTVTSIATTFPILGGTITTTGTLTFGGLSTSSSPTISDVPYFTAANKFGSIATGTLAVPTGLTVTANRYVLGGSATIGLDTGYVIPLQSTLDAKVDDTTTLTVAGTANQITSSAGAQDLTANRTWTLSLPNQVIFPQYASTTYGFSTVYASSTNYFGANLNTCQSGSFLTWTGGFFGCDTDDNSGGGSAFEIATTSNIALSEVAYISKTTGKTTLASVATSTLTINSPLTTSGTAGYLVGGSGFTIDIDDIKAVDLDLTDITLNDFTNDAGFLTSYTSPYEIATSSTLALSNLTYISKVGGRTTLAGIATTTLTASSPLSLDNPVAKVGGSNSVLSLNTSGAWSGTAGSLVNALTNGATLNGSSFNGSSAISDWDINLGNANTWTVNQTFNYSSSTIYSSFVTASTTNLDVSRRVRSDSYEA